MTTAIDTNILVALWDDTDTLSLAAQNALDSIYGKNRLIVSAVVFAELVAAPKRTEAIVEQFLDESGIQVDWMIDEPIWRSAANAYQSHAKRRRKQKATAPRRILTDFLVGAHADRKSTLC